MARGSVIASMLVGLALASIACSGGSAAPATGPTDLSSGPTTTGLPDTAPPQVPELLDFEATLVGGGTLRGAELAGSPVAIWFWAPW